MYTLRFTDENGEQVELVTSTDSLFWTSTVQLAEDTYGQENVSVTYQEVGSFLDKYQEDVRVAQEVAAAKAKSDAGWDRDYMEAQFGVSDIGRDGWLR